MPKRTTKKSKSLWNRYWEDECAIRQYCFGTDPSRVLSIVDTDIPIDEAERCEILRMLGFDPESDTGWVGVNKEFIGIMGDYHYPGLIFAGESKEPRSRFAVIDGMRRRDK